VPRGFRTRLPVLRTIYVKFSRFGAGKNRSGRLSWGLHKLLWSFLKCKPACRLFRAEYIFPQSSTTQVERQAPKTSSLGLV
ncbi:mCG1025599, partial [Mus musculus]